MIRDNPPLAHHPIVRAVVADLQDFRGKQLMPRKYGDRITAEIAGDPNAPIVSRIELVAVDPIVRSARPEELPAPDGGDEAAPPRLRALPSR